MDERGWQGIAWAVAAIALVLVGVRLLGGGDAVTAPVAVGEGATSREGSSIARGDHAKAPSGPFVHVAGAVRRPGVYRLAEGARVTAAVRRAGGPARAADLNGINLAARLQDGQQIVVPAKAGAGPSPRAGTDANVPVSLGSASAEQLDELDGIGPTLAERIVDFRRAKGGFASLDQLAEVEGIGPERLAALKAALTP